MPVLLAFLLAGMLWIIRMDNFLDVIGPEGAARHLMQPGPRSPERPQSSETRRGSHRKSPNLAETCAQGAGHAGPRPRQQALPQLLPSSLRCSLRLDS